MPLYEFQCEDCGHRFEELCSMHTTGVPCPKCASQHSRRLISAFGIGRGASGSSHSSGSSCGSCHGGHCGSCHH